MPLTDAEVRQAQGERIAAARQQAGLTQLQLAERLTAAGISTRHQSVSMWESGETSPSAARQRVLAEILGYRWRDLFDVAGVLPADNDDETAA